jgi:hypothetical protein
LFVVVFIVVLFLVFVFVSGWLDGRADGVARRLDPLVQAERARESERVGRERERESVMLRGRVSGLARFHSLLGLSFRRSP